MANTPMAQRALYQNTNMIVFLNLRTVYLFQSSQWMKTWIIQSIFSLDLYCSLKCRFSAVRFFFTYFANQLPGFSIGGTFGLRLVKNSNSFWKYYIKYPGLNTLTGISNKERMIESGNMHLSYRFNKYKMCSHLKACANTHKLQWSIYE